LFNLRFVGRQGNVVRVARPEKPAGRKGRKNRGVEQLRQSGNSTAGLSLNGVAISTTGEPDMAASPNAASVLAEPGPVVTNAAPKRPDALAHPSAA
jgi:hypothetical protein